jgi:hypothetical protein
MLMGASRRAQSKKTSGRLAFDDFFRIDPALKLGFGAEFFVLCGGEGSKRTTLMTEIAGTLRLKMASTDGF